MGFFNFVNVLKQSKTNILKYIKMNSENFIFCRHNS